MAPISGGGRGRETPQGMGANGGMGGGFSGGNGHPMSGGRTASGGELGIIPSWTSVTVQGLKGAAHHNGKVAQVESYDAADGRYAVRLPNGEGVRIKFDNLLQRLEAECRGVQSETQATLDGKTALVVGHDAEKGRYLVDLRGGDVRGGQRTSLEPANLVLPSGARCKVAGLASAGAAKWNGHIGAIVEFDREVGRYVVQMTREEQLKIRPVNLVL